MNYNQICTVKRSLWLHFSKWTRKQHKCMKEHVRRLLQVKVKEKDDRALEKVTTKKRDK